LIEVSTSDHVLRASKEDELYICASIMTGIHIIGGVTRYHFLAYQWRITLDTRFQLLLRQVCKETGAECCVYYMCIHREE